MADLFMDRTAILHFAFVTLVLGGGAGWLTGRAIAMTWRPFWTVIPAAMGLGGAVRFIHFALFEAPLLSLPLFVLDAAAVCVYALAGYRLTRARQMQRQYGFLHRD